MNYHFKAKEELFIVHKQDLNLKLVVDFFAQNSHDLVYVENDADELASIICYDMFVNGKWDTDALPYLEMNDQESVIQDCNQVISYFSSNPNMTRCPVVAHNRLLGEYALTDYVGPNILCRYNSFAFVWFLKSIRFVDEYLLARHLNHVCILADKKYWKQLDEAVRNSKVGYVVTDDTSLIPLGCTYVIDMKYPEALRRLLPNGHIPGISMYELTEAAVFEETIHFLNDHRITYLYFEGPSKRQLAALYEDEKEALVYQSNAALFMSNKNSYARKVANGETLVEKMAPIMSNGLHYTLVDYKSQEYNVKNGLRRTTCQPARYESSIHVYGPCISQGFLVKDADTIPSQLQELTNQRYGNFCVFNHGINGMGSLLNSCLAILSTPLAEGDIVIEINTCFDLTEACMAKLNITRNDLSHLFSGQHYWFFNHPFHCSAHANRIIAEHIVSKLDMQCEPKKEKQYVSYFNEQIIDKNLVYVANGIQKYVSSVKQNAFATKPEDRIAAIVMTADPFTRGHLHLVTSALKEADYLYVFVVEEETGTYSFEERFGLVSEALKQYSNVKVISTGELMHSVYTFPEYSFRGQELDEPVDPSRELQLFGEIIAPALQISVRFFGEEPADKVTRALNTYAQEILPQYGISVRIIPRKSVEGTHISASTVRQLVRTRKFDELEVLVPECTKDFLIKKHGTPDSLIKVSLIIPAYNAESYLRYSLGSACKQTFNALEIIVVNDGSTDKTKDIIDEYADADSRVKAIHLDNNVGLSSARNIGLDVAKGNYIMFLDSDDQVTSDIVQYLYDAAERTRADIAISRFKKVDQLADDVEPICDQYTSEARLFTGYDASYEFLTSDIDSQNRPFCSRVMFKLYRRELIGELRFKAGKAHEDEFFTYKLYRKAARIYYSPIQRYFYLLRDDSLSRKKQKEKDYWDALEALEERNLYYKEPNLRHAAYADYQRYLAFVSPAIECDFPNSDLNLYVKGKLSSAKEEELTRE